MIASYQLTQTALPRFPLNSSFWVTFGESKVEFGSMMLQPLAQCVSPTQQSCRNRDKLEEFWLQRK